MSKMFTIQIELAKAMAAASRQHLTEMQNKGCNINPSQLDALVAEAKHIQECDEQKAKLRAELSRFTAQSNEEFMAFKGRVAELKKMIKENYNQYNWKNFGIQDKQ